MSSRLTTLGTAVAVLVAPVALVVSTSATADAAPRVKFSSCDDLHGVFPNGVAKNAAAANSAVADGYGRPATGKRAKKVYNANFKRLDRDRDGTACEA